MRKITNIISVFVLLSLCLISCRLEDCPDGYSCELMTQDQNEMISLINSARADAGVPALRITMLSLVAINHSRDMACRDFFDHINPDGENPADRVMNQLGEDYQPPYVWISENIGGHPTARTQFDSWMASAGHRDNILDNRVNELGLALVYKPVGSRYTHYWTAVFLGRHTH